MKIVVFKGGLGNQLFQYAFYKYLSRKDETFYFYNDAWYNVSHNGFELDKYFKTDDLKKCSRFWIILFKTILSKLYHWKIYVVGSVEYQYPNHLFQAGYFLDKKYYDENTIDFKHLLLSEKNQSLLKDIQNSNSVGVHIRRGDYMTKQNLVIFGNICTQKYYHDAIRIITEKVNDAVFYVFSDDISWVQTHLDIPNAVYVNWNTGESSIYDMYLMSSCKYTMETFTLILAIVCLVFGILQIILFFKVWNMTNNVAGIKALYEKQNSEMLALLKTIASEMKEPKQHNNKESKGDIKVVAATEIKKESTSAQQPKKERPTIDRSSEEYQRKIKKWNVLKSRGYIEQAVREYMEYTGTEQNEATEFINNL